MYSIEIIYKLHTRIKDWEYIEFTENVISDMFMGKIRHGKLTGVNDKVKNMIKYFYNFANRLSNVYVLRGCIYTVYRGISSPGIIVDNKIIQPIPFSASIHKENTHNWIGLNCCILHIIFNSETLFVCINNDLEGKEVVLSAGILNIVEEWNDETVKNYKCILTGTKNYDEMVELQKRYNYI